MTARLTELTCNSSEPQSRATTEWSQVQKITRSGQTEGRVALDQFTEIYTEAHVEVGRKTVPVGIPELEEARMILAQYDVYWKKRRQRQAGTALTDIGGESAGKTYLMQGATVQGGGDFNLATADVAFVGENESDSSGYSVSFAGDVNGDGRDDILIGAQGNDDNGDRAGKTYLLFGPESAGEPSRGHTRIQREESKLGCWRK